MDTETALIAPGLLAPPLVCVSFAEANFSEASFAEASTTDLQLRDGGLERVRALLASTAVLVIHNGPFDVGVFCAEDPSLLPLVFDAYRAHRIRCTIVRQKLIDIALGMRKFRRFQRPDGEIVIVKSSYGLADLVLHYYGEHLPKADTFRLSYALLQGIPIARWPEAAKTYAIRDAVEHLRVYEAQDRDIIERWGELPNQAEQQAAAFALHLMSMWGVRAEAAAVDRFVAHCEEEIAKMRRDLAGTNILKPAYRCAGKCPHRSEDPWQVCPLCRKEKCRKNSEAGSRDMSEIRRRVVAACARLSVQVPMTDPTEKFPDGQVQTDKEALEGTDDPSLHILATQMTFSKQLGTWGPVCRAAVHRAVCSRYEVLVDTGRTSCSGSEGQEGTNFQNPDRRGDVRPCFVPRKGRVFAFTDADTIELRAHAQNCLEIVGHSKMAEALWDQHKNKGPDLHVRLAANILGIDAYVAHARKAEGDVEISLARQFAKIPNFGFPGGLGHETMVTYAAAQLDKATHLKWFGVEREEQFAKAKQLREIWFETWPENRDYFRRVTKMLEHSDGTIRQLKSGRIRGDVRFTAAANGFFQGRVADAMKTILFRFADECYTGRCTTKHAHGGTNLCTVQGRSVLYGSRLVMFLHDELIPEHPEDGSESARAERQRQIMVEGLAEWMPDVPTTSSVSLARRWHKNAEPVFVNGLLVPSKPEKFVGADGKARVRWVHDA